METLGNLAMDELEIKQRMANLDKAYAEIEKMRAENQRLLEMLPFEIEKAKAEVLRMDREWRWYPWLGASGVFALAITLLKLFGH